MDITINYANLYGIVERSLSIIAKRSVDDQGNPLFDNITLGSREKDIIYDYFHNASVDLCTELGKFMTAEIDDHTSIPSVIYTTFWTDSAASAFTENITASGQYLYKYDSGDLYISSLSFPYVAMSPEENALFRYRGTFYKWNGGLTALTPEETAQLTNTQKNAATTLSYYNTTPVSAGVLHADVYLYYDGNVYRSQRQASFSAVTIPQGAAIVHPNGTTYIRNSNVLVSIPGGLEDSLTLSLDMPDNWNNALLVSLLKGINGYCVSYALYSWFTVTAPRLAEKYQGDCNRNLSAVIRLVNEKKAPEGTTDILATSTNVTNN